MKEISATLLFTLMIIITSCSTGDSGNTGDTGDNGDNGNTGDSGKCPQNNRFCYSHAGLNWSDPSNETMPLAHAENYCYNNNGKLPTISELRTLVQNCPSTQIGGLCKVDDSCLSQTSCWSGDCLGCAAGEFYSVFGDKGWFWSSSLTEEAHTHAWRLNFDDGNLGAYDVSTANNVRCVEDKTRCPENDKFCYDNDELRWSAISRESMTRNNAEKFCESIGGRLPTISELRTLIQNCSSTETDGGCGVNDACLNSNCRNDICDGCGKGEAGIYSKFGDEVTLLSYSTATSSDNSVWYIDFSDASLDSIHSGYSGYVRCMDSNICISQHEALCYDDDVYWYDSCFNKENLKESCSFGCENGICKTDPNERWVDPDTGLSWSIMTTDLVAWDGGAVFCNNLGDNWRVPTISELRTLIKDCSGTVTGGECAITDSCLNSSCYGDECSCHVYLLGFSKIGDIDLFWSSSVNTNDSNVAFQVYFLDAGIYANFKTEQAMIRCVR